MRLETSCNLESLYVNWIYGYTIIITSTIKIGIAICSVLYKPTEQFPSDLGRFLECRQWYILVITWEFWICLHICLCNQAYSPRVWEYYIRQIPCAHFITTYYALVMHISLVYMLTTVNTHINYEHVVAHNYYCDSTFPSW